MDFVKSSENIQIFGTNIDLQQLQDVLVRYCLTLTESMWDAEDLAQETCLKAMHVIKGSYNHPNPIAFLLRIARNTRIDHVRKKRTLERKIKEVALEPSPDMLSFDVELAFQVLITHLSPLQRTVFLLRDVYGFTNFEVAGFLSTTEGAVKAALYRARSSLEAIKGSFKVEEISINDESQMGFLRALLSAYQLGDVQLLVQLAQHDLIDPAIAIGLVQYYLNRNTLMTVKSSTSEPIAIHAA